VLWLWYVVIVAHFKSAWQRARSFESQDPVWATVAVRDSVASSRAVSRAVPQRDVWAPDHGNSQGSLAKFSQTSGCHGLRESGVHDHLICLHLILFVSRFQHAISRNLKWLNRREQILRFFKEHVDLTVWRYYPLLEDWQVYQKQTHLVGVKLTTAELKLLKLEGVDSQRIVFWLVRLKPSHHVCHAIVHLLWKIAIPDPNLLKLTHASDGAAEHPVRIQLFTHTGC
jgi:hypothetical protein